MSKRFTASVVLHIVAFSGYFSFLFVNDNSYTLGVVVGVVSALIHVISKTLLTTQHERR